MAPQNYSSQFSKLSQFSHHEDDASLSSPSSRATYLPQVPHPHSWFFGILKEFSSSSPVIMSRGDQRERDRAKRQAKEAAKNKGSAREGTPQSRNMEDGAKLAAKIAAKKAQQQEAAPAAAAPVKPKKATAKKNDNLDDLLSAGLQGTKKRAK